MYIPTTGQLFPHRCQIKDMKLSGYNPSSLRYHCTACGGVLELKLDRERWKEVFGEDSSFKLSKRVLMELDIVEEEPEDAGPPEPAPTPGKFVWNPPDDEEDKG
ncbi:MAG: hypothetical protein HY319_07660 [Armatimonadetes bacterium]|nr:hypothetical protein [Armatimonadota bacterium]